MQLGMTTHRVTYFLSLLFICLFFSARCRAEDEAEELDEEELAARRWIHLFSSVKKLFGVGIKTAMPYFMSGMSDDDLKLSQGCRRALFQWISDLKAMKPWALKMADASAKAIDGILTGTFSAFGSFDQCVDTVNEKGSIRGQYCSVESWPKLPPKPRFYPVNQRLKAFRRFENDTGMAGEFTKYIQLFYMFPLRLGVCIPSSCSASDLSNITSIVSKYLFSLNITVPRCEVREPTVLENYQIPMLCVIAVLTVMVIVGTSFDLLIYRRKKWESSKLLAKHPFCKGVISDCLIAFSASSNWNKLMDLDAGARNLSVLHGIRVFSMCWIILGHTYFHLNFNILRHLQITIELTSQFIFNAVTNASLLVDNFFFLSGLLLVYVTMDIIKVIGKIPRYVYFIIHRFWRFLPMMMFFVGCSTLLPLLGDGPVWHENIDPIVEGCKKDWWVNMIFINNLYRTTSRGCLSYSWYLATDFQIYVFCIPIVILIIRKPRIGLWINFVVMILSIIGVAVHNYVRDLPPTMLFIHADIEQRSELMRETYYTPYQHVGPFCIGIFVGYYLHTYNKPFKMHWSLHAAAWTAAFALKGAALFGSHPWNKGLSGTGIIPTILYACLGRMAWTLGLAWITVACTVGYGGILGRFLRSSIFIPLSRLTFLVYMVHPLVQHVFYATLRDGIQALNHLAAFICIGFIASSYGIALILSLLLESPFINLGKIVFHRRESAKKRKRARSLSGGKVDIPSAILEVANTSSDLTSASAPPVANGYGKCNGAFESQSDICEVSRNGTLEIDAKRNEDFVCHL